MEPEEIHISTSIMEEIIEAIINSVSASSKEDNILQQEEDVSTLHMYLFKEDLFTILEMELAEILTLCTFFVYLVQQKVEL